MAFNLSSLAVSSSVMRLSIGVEADAMSDILLCDERPEGLESKSMDNQLDLGVMKPNVVATVANEAGP